MLLPASVLGQHYAISDFRKSGFLEIRISGNPDSWESGFPEIRFSEDRPGMSRTHLRLQSQQLRYVTSSDARIWIKF